MLDLDHLAQQRARRLNQTEEAWKSAVWSEAFQRFSTNMSDGEVEQLISWCPSVAHLKALVPYLEKRAREMGLTPFPCLLDLARQAKITPEAWITGKLPVDAAS